MVQDCASVIVHGESSTKCKIMQSGSVSEWPEQSKERGKRRSFEARDVMMGGGEVSDTDNYENSHRLISAS
jgi:hypothetical protein